MIVLAGGFGTRLSAVVKDVPKPLAPVAGKPFLHHLLQSWKNQGVRDFIFLVHHKAEMMEQFIREETQGILSDCHTELVLETDALGTGGAVANAVKELDLRESFLVANADTYMENGIAALAAAPPPAIATVRVSNAGRYGAVASKNGVVLSFEEKNPATGAGEINAGLYHLHPEMFSHWNGGAFSMEKDIFEKMVSKGNLRSVAVDSVFMDIGIPEDYNRFCNWMESGKNKEL